MIVKQKSFFQTHSSHNKYKFLFLVRMFQLKKIEEYAPHGLRHTHATNLANTEIPIKLLSHRLGHASVKTTMDRYAKVKPNASVKYLKKVQK